MFNAISNLISSSTNVNSGQLVSDLLAASRQPKEAALREREQLNNLKISALASASSSLDTFSAALTGLLDGRAFAGELLSSNPALASAGFISGQRPEGLPAALEIQQLASARRLASATVTDSSIALGAGTMTIASSKGSFDVSLEAGADSLNDLASAINRAGSGVMAEIMTDADGARLVLEGAEGAGEIFTTSGDFADYNYPATNPIIASGLSLIREAADAFIKVDGIDLRYDSNEISGAIQGISLSLNSASPGTNIIISGDQPSSTVSNLVTEFVDAYNVLRTALNSATAPGVAGASGGPLAGDPGVRDMIRSLGRIGSTPMASEGAYRTLSDIGVKTNNDGTLSVDTARLEAVLGVDPDAVSNMLDPAVSDAENPGLASILQGIKDRLQSNDGSLETSQKRLDKIRENIADAREKIEADSERYEAQLQRNFANMDRQLVLLQATQSYLTQQIAVWNGNND